MEPKHIPTVRGTRSCGCTNLCWKDEPILKQAWNGPKRPDLDADDDDGEK
jgi:hypothetical protein